MRADIAEAIDVLKPCGCSPATNCPNQRAYQLVLAHLATLEADTIERCARVADPEPDEVTGTDMDCAQGIAFVLKIDDSHVMPLAEFRAVSRHDERERVAAKIRALPREAAPEGPPAPETTR
jgi:hypothetical protein